MKVIKSDILKKIRRRPKESHKGDFGYLCVIGGSDVYTGAPYLVSYAALRSGCDLVKVVSTKRASDIIASYSPNVITYPYLYDIEKVRMVLITSNAFVIGNGMGNTKEAKNFIQNVLKSFDMPKVVDADAIKFSRNLKVKNAIFTPHRREFEELSGEKLSGNIKKDAEIVKNTARELNSVILVKGYVDIISDGEKVFLNKTGNPYMTKGGSGDVLAGILGSFLSQGYDAITSSSLAAYVSGRAGDIASKVYGPSLLATDIIESIRFIFRSSF